MKRIADGEVRILEGSDWWRHSNFAWGRGTGNFGCDCNRHLAFERHEDPEYDDSHLNDGDGYGCSQTDYELLSVTTEAGKILLTGEPDGDAPGDESWPKYTDDVHKTFADAARAANAPAEKSVNEIHTDEVSDMNASPSGNADGSTK